MGEVSERAKCIAEEIIRRTTCEHYRLVLNEERKPSITDSKIGGKPYWPAGKDFPADEIVHTPARPRNVAMVHQPQP